MPTRDAPNHPSRVLSRVRPAPLRVLVASLCLVCVRAATPQPVFDPPDPENVTLADAPLRIEGMGISIRTPKDAEISTNSRAGLVTTSIALPRGLGAVSVQSHDSQAEPDIFSIEESIIEEILGLPRSTTGVTIDSQVRTGRGELLGRSPVINTTDRVIRPFYFRLGEEGETKTIRGVAVVLLTPDEYAMFNLITRDQAFEEARGIFEVMLGSVALADLESIDRRRGEAVTAGVEALRALSEEDYDRVIRDIPEQFERIYRAAPGGATGDEIEVGYRRIKAWIGSRDDLTTREPSDDPDAKKDGYLLRIDGLVFLDEGQRADSRAVYYLSRNRRREAWTVEMAIRNRDGGPPQVWTEIGARSGDSMTVQIDHAGKASHTARPLIEGKGYVSRLESYLLPQLLIKSGRTGEFAFYAYDQSAEANRLRFVTVERADDRPGLWRVTTRRINDQSDTGEYNQYGRLVRSESSDGLLKRPIEFERLYKIWESKNLPLD